MTQATVPRGTGPLSRVSDTLIAEVEVKARPSEKALNIRWQSRHLSTADVGQPSHSDPAHIVRLTVRATCPCLGLLAFTFHSPIKRRPQMPTRGPTANRIQSGQDTLSEDRKESSLPPCQQESPIRDTWRGENLAQRAAPPYWKTRKTRPTETEGVTALRGDKSPSLVAP